MNLENPKVLLIHPWVRDFKCYDEWMEPLGLLWISAFFRKQGVGVEFLDCLDRFDEGSGIRPGKHKKFATGDFGVLELPKPSLFREIPRKYKQYGISEHAFLERLRTIDPHPDAILLGSGMTYWCEGVKRTVELTRSVFKREPLFLGGILPTLESDFARKIPGVDHVLSGPFSNEHFRIILKALSLPQRISIPSQDQWDAPQYDLLSRHLGHRAVVSAFGCPFQCSYCASKILAPKYFRRQVDQIFAEIQSSFSRGIRDFAFYDDALLFQYEQHLECILKKLRLMEIKPRFHTPNGMHARWITRKVAQDLHDNGFETLRIGFETDDPDAQQETGGKVSTQEMEQSLAYLREAGFKKRQIGVYLLVGLHGEPWQKTLERALWVQERGAKALPNFLSPVPFTKDFLDLSKQHPVLLENPLSHNDLFFAFYSKTVNHEAFNLLKTHIREGNV